jgi:uncharacterized repeat protein (TIGR03803 family)
MNLTKRSVAIRAAVVLAAVTFSLAVCAQAQTFTTLANFDGANGGYASHGPLVQATDGNYYGTTQSGGRHGHGVFFQVTPWGGLTDIYNFCSLTMCADGSGPWSAPVIGTDGNFYGTTGVGGNSEHAGTIYKITRGGKLTTLYNFCPASPCDDGTHPLGLVQASNGNFYGVTSNFGLYNNGTIFEFSRSGVFKVLYNFCPQFNCADGGSEPYSGLMQASNGNLYGTTQRGGAYGNGIVYEVSPAGQFRTIHSFCAETLCADGANPSGELVEDAHGNFYGTTSYGGANGFGSVFEITATQQFILLHSFDNTDGSYPISALILASDGNFYGVTFNSSTFGGTIFQITAAHQFHSLYSFCTQTACTGSNPLGTLFQATDGIFYGTTTSHGTSNDGTIFSLSTGLRPLVETIPTAGKVGARVTILGNNLAGSTGVTFNGTAASFTVISNTAITATVPAGATTGRVIVTTPTHTFRSNPAFQVLP